MWSLKESEPSKIMPKKAGFGSYGTGCARVRAASGLPRTWVTQSFTVRIGMSFTWVTTSPFRWSSSRCRVELVSFGAGAIIGWSGLAKMLFSEHRLPKCALGLSRMILRRWSVVGSVRYRCGVSFLFVSLVKGEMSSCTVFSKLIFPPHWSHHL